MEAWVNMFAFIMKSMLPLAIKGDTKSYNPSLLTCFCYVEVIHGRMISQLLLIQVKPWRQKLPSIPRVNSIRTT